MRIWRQHELGDPVELLQQEEIDSPAAGSGQVVVDTEAVGLTFVDCLMARGLYQMETRLPWSPCTEVVGRVREVGEGVGHLAVGDRVVGIGGDRWPSTPRCEPAEYTSWPKESQPGRPRPRW